MPSGHLSNGGQQQKAPKRQPSAPPGEQAPVKATGTPRRPKDQPAEIARIVRRLEAIVTTHLEGARRVHHPLTLAQVITVIDALRVEAGSESRPVAFSNGEVTFYLMDSLYEELLGEPSNIFAAVPLAEGVTRFEPLPRDFWLACLGALRQRLERLGLEAN